MNEETKPELAIWETTKIQLLGRKKKTQATEDLGHWLS